MKIKFLQYLRAGYPLIWVNTHEEVRAIRTLSSEAIKYTIYSWDIVKGIYNDKQNHGITDPLRAIEFIENTEETSIIFLKDFHRFINAIEIIRTIKNLTALLKVYDKHLVFISPITNIPIELEKDIIIYNFELPNADDIKKIADTLIKDTKLKISIDNEIIETAKGLTFNETEDAFALSLLISQQYDKKIIENEKLQIIKKGKLLEIWQPVNETELGGSENLKNYIKNRKKGFMGNILSNPKGIILIGPPGSGKTLATKVIAFILNIPLIRLDIGSLKGSLVGESESKMRQALQIIDACSPCVVLMDEIEKLIGGVQSSARSDGGTTSAMFGYLLTWMQESESKKYIVGTCNDYNELFVSQGALVRRFDDIFWIDFPDLTERKIIINIMNNRYNTNIAIEKAEHMDNWTGAEIEKFTKASIYDGEDNAFNSTKPLYYQNKEIIDKSRKWAIQNAKLANINNIQIEGRKINYERNTEHFN